MAESMSVRAILSAQDRGFSSTLKSAAGSVNTLSGKIKSGLGFGILTGMGQQAFSAITSGCRDMIGELNSSSAAWQTFESNMKILGKGDKEIKGVKKELQSFAEQTIYSSSDMAQTYAQLAAVGTKNTDKLVMGFGGLAAAAENPQQAMKTLSQQATQMAAKPNVAWQDFKLMLEQTPAGISAVAKSMGMTTSQLVTAVQDGTVKTEDFFAAIEKVGTSKGFTKMATSYKTTEQAMDGLKETLANKLMPSFQLVSNKAIGGIEKIIDALSKVDGEALSKKVAAGIKAATPYWNAFVKILKVAGKVVKAVGKFLLDHSNAIAKALPYVVGLGIAFKGYKTISKYVPFITSFTKSITSLAGKGIGGIAAKLFGISKGEKEVGKASMSTSPQMLAAAKSFALMGAAVLMISAGFALLAFSAIKLAESGGLAIGVMAGMVLAVVGLGIGMGILLKSLAPIGSQLVPVATAMLMMSAAVILVAAGFALLAFSAISLANAGTPAIAVMVGMVAAIALLAVGAALLGPALTAGAVGFIAFGAAILLVGAGVLLASVGMALLATQLPIIAQYGTAAAVGIFALGAGMLVLGAGSLVAGAGCLVLGAGLIVVAAGLLVAGVAAAVAAVGLTAMAAASLVAGAGLLVATAAILIMAATLPLAAAGGLMLTASMLVLSGSALVVSAALIAASAMVVAFGIGALAASIGVTAFGVAMIIAMAGTIVMAGALKMVKSQMKGIASSAKSAQKSLTSMRKAVKVVESGLNAIGSKAKSAMSKLTSAFSNAASKAKSSGKKVGTGFSNGVKSGMTKSVSAAKSGVSKVISALNTGKSKAYNCGRFISIGFSNGMKSMLGTVRATAQSLANEADKAIRAKAKIGSPSKVADKLGSWWGEGYANGIASMARSVWRASSNLVSIPNIATPAMAYSGSLSEDYSYSQNSNYTIEVPLSVDGREFARATVNYTQDELNKQNERNNRKKGRR